eukprot:3932891-Rhodomonas_salina.1
MHIIVPSARQTVAKGLVRKDPPERNGHEPRNRLISRTAVVARREVDERQEKRGSNEEVADVADAPGPKDRDPDAKAHDAHPHQLHHQPGQRHAADEAETLRARIRAPNTAGFNVWDASSCTTPAPKSWVRSAAVLAN